MGACAVGAATNVLLDWGLAALGGRKYTWGDAGESALLGCLEGLILPGGGGIADDLLGLTDDAVKWGDDLAGALCSFSAETTVATEEGDEPIGEIAVGDEVLAWDEATGETGFYPVTAIGSHADPVVVRLTIDGETIQTTPEHPFFTDERGWVPAVDLWIGAGVRKADGGIGVVESISFEQRTQPMYNLTVEQAPTYFVGDGQWLVHNTC